MLRQTSISIRDITDLADLKAVEDLQLRIWGCSEREVVASLVLKPLLEIGGVLIGAFDGNELIGFVLGFPGLENGFPILHSDMLGVLSQYRSEGLGYQLKLAQREKALQKGIDRITWTFDPLQSRNAHLNFARLGVISDRYDINYYGETSSFLHRTGTDRLWVTWLLKSERVVNRIASSCPGPPPITGSETVILRALKDAPEVSSTELRGNLIIEVPTNIDEIIADDYQKALRWREATRHAFTSAIKAGYFVVEYSRVLRSTHLVGAYVLKRIAT